MEKRCSYKSLTNCRGNNLYKYSTPLEPTFMFKKKIYTYKNNKDFMKIYQINLDLENCYRHISS